MVARRLCRALILTISTSERESYPNSETRESTFEIKKICTTNSIVIRRVTWPHDLVYTSTGQPAVYEELSVTLFVSRYLAGMETVKAALEPIMAKHLKELMADADVYGWAQVSTYRAVWLQQIENG